MGGVCVEGVCVYTSQGTPPLWGGGCKAVPSPLPPSLPCSSPSPASAEQGRNPPCPPKANPLPSRGGGEAAGVKVELGGAHPPARGCTQGRGRGGPGMLASSIPGTLILPPRYPHPPSLVPASSIPAARIQYPPVPASSGAPGMDDASTHILHLCCSHPPTPVPASSIPRYPHLRILHPPVPASSIPASRIPLPPSPPSLHPSPVPRLPAPPPPPRCPRDPPAVAIPVQGRPPPGLRAGGAGRGAPGAPGRAMGRAERRWAPGPRPRPQPPRSPRLPVRLAPAAAVSEKGAEPPPGGGGLKGPGTPLHDAERGGGGGQHPGKLRQSRGGASLSWCVGGCCLSFPTPFPLSK